MIKMLSLFSGIGAFEKALKRRNIPFELVGFSEIDKYAVKSYCAIHDVSEDKNLGDITKIDEKMLPKNIDLITYGFPCQDISRAGNQKGLFNEDGSQTRSGLFFDALRIIEHTQPKIAIAENVKNLTSKKFRTQFQIILESLEKAGYSNYWQILNSKDFGIPQNRKRVFVISIRKDIDAGCFEFPKPLSITPRLKDILEDEVGERFFLSDERVKKLIERKTKSKEKNGWDCVRFKNEDDIIGSLLTNPEKTQNYIITGCTVRGRNTEITKTQQTLEVRKDELSNTLTTVQINCLFFQNRRVRKPTPLESWRLFGFDDEDFYKAAAVNSDNQLYKQAGNSIVVNVIEAIFRQLEENQKWLRGEAKSKRSLIKPFELLTRLFRGSEAEEE